MLQEGTECIRVVHQHTQNMAGRIAAFQPITGNALQGIEPLLAHVIDILRIYSHGIDLDGASSIEAPLSQTAHAAQSTSNDTNPLLTEVKQT